MITQHHCWWTRHHRSELGEVGGAVVGAGCPREVLEHAAELLGARLVAAPAEADDDGERIALGAGATGTAHDDCFFELGPASTALKRALLTAVLDLHATYLGREVDWSGVLDRLAERLEPGHSLRFRSRPRRRQLAVGVHRRPAGPLGRTRAGMVIVDCAGARAVIV